jgi:hypothetical protein
MFKVILRLITSISWIDLSGVVQYIKIFQKYVNHRMRIQNCCTDQQSGYVQKSHTTHIMAFIIIIFLLDVIFGGLWLYTIIYKDH